MGFDVDAYAIVGVRFNATFKLFNLVKVLHAPHNVPEGAEYCPECGHRAYRDEWVDVEGYDRAHSKYKEFDCVVVNDRAYLGRILAQDYKGQPFILHSGDYVEFSRLRDELVKVLKELNVTEANLTFGLYCVARTSW